MPRQQFRFQLPENACRMLGYIFLMLLSFCSLMFYNRCLLQVCHHSFQGADMQTDWQTVFLLCLAPPKKKTQASVNLGRWLLLECGNILCGLCLRNGKAYINWILFISQQDHISVHIPTRPYQWPCKHLISNANMFLSHAGFSGLWKDNAQVFFECSEFIYHT